MKIYNYGKDTLEKIQGLRQGFYLSYDSQKRVVLSIKTIPGIISALVNGCPINLALAKSEQLVTLFIMDNSRNPYYFKGHNFSYKVKELQNVESVVIDLIKAESFKLVILNEANYQIINAEINKENSFLSFDKWLNSPDKEFEIQLSNISFKNQKKVIYIDSLKNKIWNDNLINNKPYFNFDEYVESGKHGYNQEFSIRNMLSEFYQPNKELFSTVMKKNGEELTDFLILYEKAIVIIESKFTISSKQTKFNDAISKAIRQLNKAEQVIDNDPELIDNDFIKKEVLDYQVILKICIFYDDGRNLEKAFQNVQEKYAFELLPIFISINVLDQYMSYLKILNSKEYKYNIIENLLKIKLQFRKNEKVIIIDGFDLTEGSVTFVNQNIG